MTLTFHLGQYGAVTKKRSPQIPKWYYLNMWEGHFTYNSSGNISWWTVVNQPEWKYANTGYHVTSLVFLSELQTLSVAARMPATMWLLSGKGTVDCSFAALLPTQVLRSRCSYQGAQNNVGSWHSMCPAKLACMCTSTMLYTTYHFPQLTTIV